MEKLADSDNSKHVISGGGWGDLPVPGVATDTGTIQATYAAGHKSDINNKQKDPSNGGRESVPDGGDVSVCSSGPLTSSPGQDSNTKAQDNTRRTGASELDDKTAAYVNFDLNTWTRDHDRRPRTLAEVSHPSHGSSHLETKDDLYLGKANPSCVSHIDNSRTVSVTSLAGPDTDLTDSQLTDADLHTEEAATLTENLIVSGNIRNNHGNSQPTASHPQKMHISPISIQTGLNVGDIASESTPRPSAVGVFRFPSVGSEPQNVTNTNSLSPTSSISHPATTNESATNRNTAAAASAVTDTSIVATQTLVHATTTTPAAAAADEDIPLSLRNLVFLTKPEPAVAGPVGGSSQAIIHPTFLLANERKRSNLKKPGLSGTTPGLVAANNTSLGSSTGSLHNMAGKKSIKWLTDIPGQSNKPQSSTQATSPAAAAADTKPQPPLTCTETTSGDYCRKVSPGSATSPTPDTNVPARSPAEVSGRKDGQGCRGDKLSLGETSTGRLTPGRTAGSPELTGRAIIGALGAIKQETEGEEIQLGLLDVSLGSLDLASSVGGMSTPGDLTPKGYLTDNEDTVTSMDEVQRRDPSAAYSRDRSTAAAVDSSALRESVVSDDVFTSSNRNNKAKLSGCIPGNLRDSLAVILSAIYGIIIIVLGLVLPLSETFAHPQHPYFFEVFYLYLYAGSLVFLIYVYSYLLRTQRSLLETIPRTISRTLSRTFSRSSMRSRSSMASEKSGSVATKPLVRENSNLSVSAASYRRRKKIAYNPEVSKHTGSFFLRVGVIGFGIGSMIHSALTFGHYFEVSHLDSHCSEVIQAVKPLAHLCFTFVQMYFIFMNSKMCVHKYKTLARFGLMHMSCTNVCVWLRSVVVETLQVIKVGQRDTYNVMVKAYEEYRKDAEEDSDEKEPVQSLEEYMQGVLYVMWSNVGVGITVKRADSSSDVKRADSSSDVDTLDSDDDDNDSEDDNVNHKMSVDCAASSKGLFLGIFLFVIAVVCIVCFHVLASVQSHLTLGTLLGHVSEEVILVVALMATAMAGFQMRHMSFSSHRQVGIEEILSLVSISGLGLYGIWSIIAAVFHLETLHGRLTLATNLLMLVQAGSQATFTLAALRASARNHQQLREKPGRQCVTFLIICNFALWVVNTFETQRIEYNHTQVNFYGTTAWAIFSHISVPLGIYFRFNATVNLSIVWKKAWKKKYHDGALHTPGTQATDSNT